MPAPDGWMIAKFLWDNKEWVRKRLADLYAWVQNRAQDRGILIIGSAGTGKTTLAKMLCGKFDWLVDSPWEYRESPGIEHYSLTDDSQTEIIVLPGQRHRRATAWVDINADIATGKYAGIILVGSYGYQNLNRSYKHHPLYESNKQNFLDAYLARCRDDEMGVLDHVISAIQCCAQRQWLLTLVTKQDLWFDDVSAVHNYYAGAPFGEKLAGLVANKPPSQFRHEHSEVSLLISNFETIVPERLKKNVEGYDQKLQVQSVRKLLEVLDALRQWEEQE